MEDETGTELHELQEQVIETVEEVKEELSKERLRESRERQWLNLLGISTGILAALAAIAALQAGSLANEAMLAQINASDQWSLYQAKSTKRHIEESTVILLQNLQKPIPPSTSAEVKKLNQEQNEIQIEARKLQQESSLALHRHELFAHTVAALQIAISLSAVAALLRKKSVWYLSLALAGIGIGFMILGAVKIY